MYEHILHLSESEKNEEKLNLDIFNEFDGIMDYATRGDEEEVKSSFAESFSYMGYGEVNIEEGTVSFSKNLKEIHFKRRYEEFKENLKDVDFETFSGPKLKSHFIRDLIYEQFGIYVYINNSIMGLDDFIRYHYKEGKTYHLIDIMLYHY